MSGSKWQQLGVLDPADPDAAGRLELLEWISAQGISDDDIVAAAAADQLTSVVGDRALRPGARMTLDEASVAVGIPIDDLASLQRAIGTPHVDGRSYITEGDLPMFRIFAEARALFSEEELTHFSRVVGTSMRRIAEAASEMFLRDVEAPIYSGEGGGRLDVAKANLFGVELARQATSIFDPIFRVHLERSTQDVRRALVGSSGYATVPLTVGFVDLNGFTSRSAAMEPHELLDLVMAFEAASIDLVAEHGGRLIKLIGDEVMFTAVESGEACAIADGLVRHADRLAGGGRAGLAHGPVIASGGDVYGETVNLAARIVDVAVPGEILVNEAVVGRVDGPRFEAAGRRQLKGFAEPVRLWSLEP
ncbi:MAG: adenylate/guanylate cyclase domain-containing protein [Ilumatobacteraceae bacterium]